MGKRTSKQTVNPFSRWLPVMGVIAIVVMVFIAYAPAIHGGFIWDDEEYVSRNELLTAPDGLQRIWFSTDSPSQYFPLVYTSFRIERAVYGLETTGYHVDNIILHILNALLIWLILRKLSIKGAWFAAAIFALHPVNVESVAWITERKNVLSTLFYLLTVVSWMRFRDKSDWRFYGLALLACALSLFAKTTACTIPAALLVVSWLRQERVGWRELALMVPFGALGVGAGLTSIWWEHHKQGTTGEMFSFTPADRVLIAGRSLWFYLGKLVWPSKLAFSYPKWNIDSSQAVQYLWVAACAAAAAGLWWFRRKVGRGPIAAATFFVAALVPMLGFFSLYTFRYSYVADHYQYLASVGPIALITVGLVKLGERMKAQQNVRYGVTCVVLVLLSILTWKQAHAYIDLEHLWTDTIAKNPKSWMAHNNLAALMNEEGRYDEAMTHADEALRLNPESWTGQATMGNVLVHLERPEEALPHFRKAIKLRPDWPDAYYSYGIALGMLRRTDDAIAQYRKAIAITPKYAEARLNLGVALADKGDFGGAIEQFRAILDFRPDMPNVHRNLAVAYFYKGEYATAWQEVHLAAQNGDELNPLFIQGLSEKMPDPGAPE